MRKRLTNLTLQLAAPKSGRLEVRDTDSRLILRVTAADTRSFCVRTRIAKKLVRLTYADEVKAENLPLARKWAHDIVEECKNGIDPRLTPQLVEQMPQPLQYASQTFDALVSQYVERRLRKEKRNRSAGEVEKLFARYVIPRWKDVRIATIRRRDVNALLDEIFDGKVLHKGKLIGGPAAADYVLAHLRAFFNWYAVQDDEFTSPIVSGMSRTSPRDRARTRILSDDEVRVMWPLLDNHGIFGAIVKLLLLSGQRRDEVSCMSRAEITGVCFEELIRNPNPQLPEDAIWTIPAARYKTNVRTLCP